MVGVICLYACCRAKIGRKKLELKREDEEESRMRLFAYFRGFSPEKSAI
jgi:hypothetical protein